MDRVISGAEGEREEAARQREIKASGCAATTTQQPQMGESRQSYLQRRLKTLATEWPEGKRCHFRVIAIEYDRMHRVQLQLLREKARRMHVGPPGFLLAIVSSAGGLPVGEKYI